MNVMCLEIEDYKDVSRMLLLKAAALLDQGRYDDAEKLKLMLKLLDSYMCRRRRATTRGRPESAPPPPQAPPPPSDDAARELTTEEERVAKAAIIAYFPRGMLDCRRGTTIEAYLAEKLHLEPAHVTELFDGDLSVGFVPCKTENIEFARALQALLVHRFPSHFKDASVAYAASAASPARADAVAPAPASSSTPASTATAAPAPAAADETWFFNCRCGDKGWGFGDGSAMWQCEKCESWQHERCVSIGGGGPPSPYLCHECAPVAAPSAAAAAPAREEAEASAKRRRLHVDEPPPVPEPPAARARAAAAAARGARRRRRRRARARRRRRRRVRVWTEPARAAPAGVEAQVEAHGASPPSTQRIYDNDRELFRGYSIRDPRSSRRTRSGRRGAVKTKQFRPQHAVLFAHVWMLHRALEETESLGRKEARLLQEAVFDELWEDTTAGSASRA
ncbi:hypothetical protein SO694_000671115 [Aureococcus anophagefferens]|uniref:Zinc finger PHD-type domain-containing protein n=1 Tax=Aureococcus anophagefferens TaxID=44056 RepID=A0ABR1FQR5_AURAN